MGASLQNLCIVWRFKMKISFCNNFNISKDEIIILATLGAASYWYYQSYIVPKDKKEKDISSNKIENNKYQGSQQISMKKEDGQKSHKEDYKSKPNSLDKVYEQKIVKEDHKSQPISMKKVGEQNIDKMQSLANDEFEIADGTSYETVSNEDIRSVISLIDSCSNHYKNLNNSVHEYNTNHRNDFDTQEYYNSYPVQEIDF